MNPENIRYMAKVNAAYHLIHNARKIARRLADATPEQRLAIEPEIVEIGMRLYNETRQQSQPEVTHDPGEVTHDPGEDHELEAYIAAVRELVPDAPKWFVINDYHHRFTIEQSAERWRNHVKYTLGREQR